MSVNIEFRKSTDLTPLDKREICDLFLEVYGKPKLIRQFEHQFEDTVLGYSFHGIMRKGNKIVGIYTNVPMAYRYCGKEYIFGLSVDTMIKANYRGNLSNLIQMANLVYEAEMKDNIPFVYGFPNENFYLVKNKVLKWKDMGSLDYYFLALRLDNYDRKLILLNPVTKILSCFMNLTTLRRNQNESGASRSGHFRVEKLNTKQFRNYRYKLFPVDYNVVDLDSTSFFSYLAKPFYYIHDILERMKVVFLMDVYPMEKKVFEKAARHIYVNEKGLDLIIFIGKLRFSPRNLLKLPKKYEPKSFKMLGKILIEGAINEDVIFDINNWNVNLSDFDLI